MSHFYCHDCHCWYGYNCPRFSFVQ
uniref:Uncharacterized protein n=1 Tax=Anguilla anguilla TaxID=7936 RepID=A0A0E9U437_ANGAN